MKVKVLGKYGPYGKAGVGAASGYLVHDEGFNLLLDMGSGVLSRLIAEIDVRNLDGVFISHLHYDHTSDLLPFKYLLEEIPLKVKIYTQKDDSEWYKILFDDPLFEVMNVDKDTVLNIKGKKITFYEMNHPVPDLGIRIEDEKGVFAYTGDTRYNENLKPLLSGASAAIVDCSKPEVFIGGHMRAVEGKRIKKEIPIKLLIASHASPDYDPTPEFEGVEGIVFAREFAEYDIE